MARLDMTIEGVTADNLREIASRRNMDAVELVCRLTDLEVRRIQRNEARKRRKIQPKISLIKEKYHEF